MNTSDYINNREISTIIWIIVLILSCLTQKKFRQSFSILIKDLRNKKLILLFSSMLIYIVIMVLVFNKIHFWDPTAIKDTLIWTIGSVILLIKMANTTDVNLQFKNAVIDNIKFVVIVEFIINLYSFSLFIEIILVPIVCIISLMYFTAGDKKEHKVTKSLLGGILAIIGIIIIIFTIISIFSDITSFIKFKNIRDFMLPIVFTVLYLPFVYIWALIMNYEKFFTRLFIRDHDKQLFNYVKKVTIIKCNLNLPRINRLSNKIGLLQIDNKNDIIELIESGK